MTSDANKRKLLYKIAKAYYEDDLTQARIGKRFGLSRIKVSRLLQQAREEKLVQIVIIPPEDSNADLERELEAKYGLDESVIISPSSYDKPVITRELGKAAADYFIRGLQGQEVVAVSWGYTLLSTVDALSVNNWPEMIVVQMTGGLGRPESEIYGADVPRRMAQALGAKPHLIPAPAVVTSKMVRDALLADSLITDTLAMAAKADVAVVGIGVLGPGSVVMQASTLLTAAKIEDLEAQGAVGDIALRFFDAEGRPVEDEVNDRMIGLSLGQVRRIPRVIGVAGGVDKFEVIRAALRGKLVKVLVTDDQIAARLLAS